MVSLVACVSGGLHNGNSFSPCAEAGKNQSWICCCVSVCFLNSFLRCCADMEISKAVGWIHEVYSNDNAKIFWRLASGTICVQQ